MRIHRRILLFWEVIKLDIRVRVSETDMLGHINNTSYFIYMEETRIAFLEDLGIDIERESFAFMLASAKCDFVSQGYFGQILDVATEVGRIGNKSITLVSIMKDKESGRLIAKGEAVLVYFDTVKQATMPIPESFKRKLADYAQSA
ncbi:acyl-CoA thioesterase [Virgibacillus kekensis]|uniref:Acyl-CoA thioesterase n=1 Tax=Virgibacillus kekensis TaxID=202261 RepID=A0ABV9DJ69_9BACI